MKSIRTCGCGCGGSTNSKFAVGHDSRFVSAQIALALAEPDLTDARIVEIAAEVEKIGSLALALKFQRNLAKAQERKAAPPKARVRAPRPQTDDADARGQARAASLVARLESDYWTGQTGTVDGLEARVMRRLGDGKLAVRVMDGGQVREIEVAKAEFSRPSRVLDDVR